MCGGFTPRSCGYCVGVESRRGSGVLLTWEQLARDPNAV